MIKRHQAVDSMYDFYKAFADGTETLSGARPFPKWTTMTSPQQVEAGMTPGNNPSQSMTGIRFVALPDAQAVGRQAAQIVAEQLAHKPDSSIVFPTGKTPLPMYAALRAIPEINWSHSRLFQLDEYMPPAQSQPNGAKATYETFAEFMDRELWGAVSGHKHYIRDYVHNTREYERLLAENGGPDLVILGIGGNGHVAFNEPGSPSDSTMRVINLAKQTIQANFGHVDRSVPTQAMTLGLENILQARQILLLATGTGKRNIVCQAFNPETPPSIDCPASWLKRHPSVMVMTDFEVECGFD